MSQDKLTPPPDASRDGLVQMSDQVLAQALDDHAYSLEGVGGGYGKNRIAHLREAARRLRAASRLRDARVLESAKRRSCRMIPPPDASRVRNVNVSWLINFVETRLFHCARDRDWYSLATVKDLREMSQCLRDIATDFDGMADEAVKQAEIANA